MTGADEPKLRGYASEAAPHERALDRLWSVEDLASYLGVPKNTIYKWRQIGYGPPGYPIGKWVKFKPAEVIAWLDTRKDDWESPR